jgi:hypothetical protein
VKDAVSTGALKPYEITSLKPGFVIITYRPELIDPWTLMVSSDEWAKLEAAGYSGGIIVPHGTEFHSLDAALMADLGWRRA